ncbi:MAG: hypothetical protein U9Q04_08745, partial [Campylobacterota bacterium]|nr:hypothetical protein [Campylobacterota bacterium]
EEQKIKAKIEDLAREEKKDELKEQREEIEEDIKEYNDEKLNKPTANEAHQQRVKEIFGL